MERALWFETRHRPRTDQKMIKSTILAIGDNSESESLLWIGLLLLYARGAGNRTRQSTRIPSAESVPDVIDQAAGKENLHLTPGHRVARIDDSLPFHNFYRTDALSNLLPQISQLQHVALYQRFVVNLVFKGQGQNTKVD